MLHLALIVALTAPPCAEPQAWLDGDRQSKDERRETRRRLERTWKALGADRDAVQVLSAIALRESTYDACAIHRLGVGEDGAGAMGLARLHRTKWHGEWLPRVPEVSAVVAWRILRNAKHRYRVRSWAIAGEIYAGRMRPIRWDEHKQNRFCARLERRGVDCRQPMSRLGDALPRGASPEDVPFAVALTAAAGSG